MTSVGRRAYRALVRLTPPSFRREYAEEMCRVADEQWAEERAAGAGPVRAGRFWTRQSLALLRAAAALRSHENGKRGGVTMEGFGMDLGHAARALIRRPGFTAVTVLTLGLGIGATTAIFSAVHTVLLRPLPYADAERVVVIFQDDAVTGERGDGVSAANIRDFAEASTLFSTVSVAEPWSLDLQVEGRVESLRTWTVARGFFDAIGGRALLGRTFTDADYDEGSSAIVILSHRSWTNRFGADPGIVGRDLTLDGQALTVVGVMPPEYGFPDVAEAWIPRNPQPWDEGARSADFMIGVARLAPGVGLGQASAEADRIAEALRGSHPDANEDMGFALVPLREHLFGDVRTPLLVILAAVAFVLLIACANVAGLMLARGAQREREYALRGALGAGTGRLVGHVSAEALLLALAGCALGVALTYAGIGVIRALGPDHLPRIDELRVDGTVLAFAVLTAGFSAVLSGLAPSLRLSRPDLRGALGDGTRGSTGGVGRARARSHLVVAQVAAAVVLLVGAGLLLRSFGVLLDEELGFDPEDRLALQVFAYDYPTSGDRVTFVNQAVENMQALPGVRGVAITSDVPAGTDGVIAKIEIQVPFTIEDRAPPPAGQEPITSVINVSRSFFEVMGIDVVAGRSFGRADDSDGAPVILVNETLARRHFGEADPLGERLVVRFGNNPIPREIVGVVRDTRPYGHASPPQPEVYFPLTQVGSGSLTFVVHAGVGGAGALLQPAMQAIWDANPSQSVYGAATIESLLSEWLKERRFNLFLIGAFALVALVLAAIGIYGLVSFSVERRMGELGIRRALGGRSGDLLSMVLGEGTRLAGLGLAIGVAAAWYLSRFLQGMMYEVQPHDPLTFALLGGVVLAIALLATLVPAVRAMRVDPVEALRAE